MKGASWIDAVGLWEREMSVELEGLVLTFALVGAVVFFGWALGKSKIASKNFVRKFVHIGVSCFYFVFRSYLYQAELWVQLIPPVSCFFANFLVAYTGKPKSLVFEGGSKYGTAYYPASLAFLVVMLEYEVLGMNIEAFGAGVLVMGFGDGLAGLIGKAVNGKRIGFLKEKKTWVGSVVMLLVSFGIIFWLYGEASDWTTYALYVLCALFATVVEALSAKGVDNITVPVLTAFFCALVLR